MQTLRTLLAERRYADAHARADALLVEYPESLDLLHLAAIAYARVGKAERAKELFEQALMLAPEDPVLHLNLAQLHLAKGDLSDARTAYRNAAVLDPNLSPAHTALADLAAYEGKPADAEELYLTALRADPNSVSALMGQAHLLLNRNAVAEAMPMAQRALKLAEKDARAQALMGRALLLNGNPAFARRALENATRLEPRFFAAWVLLAQTKLSENDLLGTEAALIEAAKRAPNDPSLRLTRAELYARSRRPELAYDDLEAVLVRLPQHLLALRRLTRMDLERGEQARAVARLEKAASAHPENELLTHDFLSLLLDSWQPERALAFARAWCVRVPQLAVALTHLAALEEAHGSLDAGATAAERALALDSQQTQAVLVLARARLKHGRPGEALTLLNGLRTHKLLPTQSIELERMRGRAFDAVGDRHNALTCWQQAAQLQPATPNLPPLSAPKLLPALPPLNTASTVPVVFLIGLPGSGLEALVWWLIGIPGVAVFNDRFGAEPRVDALSNPRDERLDLPYSASDLEHIRRRYVRGVQRLAPKTPGLRLAVDWLPVLDVRQYRVLAAAMPEARWLLVHRDPRDCLLSSIVNGAQGLPLTQLSDCAQLLNLQQQHMQMIEQQASSQVLNFHFEQGKSELEKLGKWLGLEPLPSEDRWRVATSMLGGLPQYFVAKRWQAYEKPLKEMFELCSPGS